MPKRQAKKIDVTDELVASLEQVVAIVEGRMAPARVHQLNLPDIDVTLARKRLGMTQTAFATAFGVPLPTLRKWEQRVRRPKGAARVLLKVIELEPDAVRRALASKE